MNSRKKIDKSYSLDLFKRSDNDNQVKFDLYVQLRKVKQITHALDEALVSSREQEREWLAENQELIDSFLSELLDDSMLVLDGVQLDDESIDLSLNLMHDIRHTLDLMQQVVYDEGDGN